MAIAIAGLAVGLASSTAGNTALAAKLWTAGTSPLLLASMTRKVLAGRLGVDAVAFVAMSAAPRTAHRLAAGLIEEVSLDCVAIATWTGISFATLSARSNPLKPWCGFTMLRRTTFANTPLPDHRLALDQDLAGVEFDLHQSRPFFILVSWT
jgi:hypothetical protein